MPRQSLEELMKEAQRLREEAHKINKRLATLESEIQAHLPAQQQQQPQQPQPEPPEKA